MATDTRDSELRRHRALELFFRFPPLPQILATFAPVMVGAVIIYDAVAYGLFNARVGWTGVSVSALFSALLTYYSFRFRQYY